MVTGVVGVTWSRLCTAQFVDVTLCTRLAGRPYRCQLAADGASGIPCKDEMTHGLS